MLKHQLPFRPFAYGQSLPALRSAFVVCSLLLIGSWVGAAHPLWAQEAGDILVARAATEIHVGKEVVGRLHPGDRVTVQSVNGEWVSIKHGISGWVPGQYLIAEKQALEYFNARLQKDPHDLAAYLGRARMWKDQSDHRLGQAIGEWTESARLNPQQGAAYLQRARLWRAKQSLGRAIADLETAIKLQPFDVEAYQELGEVYLERGEYRRAVNNFTEVIRLKPWQPEPFSDRAWANFLMGERAAAMFDLQVAQRLDPRNARTTYRIGLVRIQDQQLAQAKVDFDKAIEIDPRMAEAYFARAPLHRAEELIKNPKEQTAERNRLAQQDYNMAIHLSPQYAEAYVGRAKLWQDLGEWDRAIKDLTTIVALNPQHAASYFDRGKIYLQRSEGELALADFIRTAELEPEFKQRESETFVKAYRQRAEQYMRERKFDLAAADYSAAVEITPEDWELLAARGQAYLALKDYSHALADLSAVSKERNEDPAAWFALAHAWYLAGQYGRAAVEYRKAILVEPTFVAAYTNLAWLLATCPDEDFRNGKLAVRYATYACEMTGWKQYAIIDTLAAAQAEAGDFHEAIKLQSAVVYMAPPGQRADFQSRLALYGGLKPYREVREENSGLNKETDTTGVLAAGDNSAASFAKSLEGSLEDLDELAEKNRLEAEKAEAEAAATAAAKTKEDPSSKEKPSEEKTPAVAGTKEPTPSKPVAAETLKKDDPAAIAALKKLGGRISMRPTGEVQSMGLQYTKFNDRDIALLEGVPSLEIIDLTFTQIGEPTIKKLGTMKQLKLIVLDQTKVTDDLLANLADLPNLEVISVKATTISGKGLEYLQKLPKLSMILINGTRVTSSEIKQLELTMPKAKLVR
jgi:tetratricopeptide (TPR) repeat protein